MMDILKLQTQLTAAALPSGFEEPQRKLLAELAAPYVDEITTDTLGNLICHKKGPGKRIIFPAHMDVIGLMITFVDENGFLRFEPIGGHSPAGLISATVKLESGVRGTIWADGEARVSRSNYGEVDIHDLYIDIGAEGQEEAEKLASIGSVATFDASPAAVAGGNMMTPYADNLSSCIALLIAMEQLKDQPVKNDLYFVFTVQEEVGLRGVKSAAWRVNPDMGIAVDVTATGDTPRQQKHQRMQVSLGKGPTIKIKDGSLLCNPQVKNHLRQAAEQAGIAWQDEILLAGGTDAGAVQISRDGVLSGCVSIPCRNIHTPGEIVNLQDVENAGRLIAAAALLELK